MGAGERNCTCISLDGPRLSGGRPMSDTLERLATIAGIVYCIGVIIWEVTYG
jgi:hypothetical protein